MSKINKASFESKKSFKLPAGAKIISKEVRMTVEEIENGYLLIKIYDIKYQQKGKDYNDYEYFTRKYFSETNPITINDSSMEDEEDLL